MPITEQKLLDHIEAKTALDVAKKEELSLRTEICNDILDGVTAGTKHFKKFGLDAAAVAKVNIKVDKLELKSIYEKLSEEEKSCIEYEPKIKMKLYKELPPDSVLHRAVVSKPGTPSLTIQPIKE